MKKKLKALLIAEQPSGNEALDRSKKALKAAILKFKKAKAAKSDARSAFNKVAEQWLSHPKESSKPAGDSGRKVLKAAKAG